LRQRRNYKILQVGHGLLSVYEVSIPKGPNVMKRKVQQPNWVIAVFQNTAVSIGFARKTTWAQLAEQLSALGEIHGKLLLPIHVRVALAPAYSPGNPLRRNVTE